jgi:hypothetical protein
MAVLQYVFSKDVTAAACCFGCPGKALGFVEGRGSRMVGWIVTSLSGTQGERRAAMPSGVCGRADGRMGW